MSRLARPVAIAYRKTRPPCVHGRGALGLALRTRVNAVGDFPAGIVTFLACALQRYVGVCAQREQLLDAAVPVSESPETAAGGRDQQE